MWRLAVLIGHLEEEEIGELLQVVTIAYTIIAEGITEGPDFGDDGGRIVTRCMLTHVYLTRDGKSIKNIRI